MSLVATALQNLREQSANDKYEMRGSRYGALDLFIEQTADQMGIISPNLRNTAISSIGQTLQVPVINYDSGVSIGNTLSATISDDENTSALISVSFTAYTFGFTMVPSLYKNNEISYQRDFNAKMMKYINALGATLDNACLTALNTAKTQVLANDLGYTFASNTLTAPAADEENIIGDIEALMQGNDFYDQVHLVGNMGLKKLIGRLAQNAGNQAVFKELQYLDKRLHFTNRLADAANRKMTAYAVNAGSVGYVHRFEREALAGTLARTGHEWGIDTLPILNFPIGTYYYESVGDYNAIAGASSADMTRVMKEHYGFAVFVAFLTAYNSDAANIASPILKIDVATS